MPRDAADLPVTSLLGVGPSLGERFARIGIETVQDLLFHLPVRYEDRTRVIPVGHLEPSDHAAIEVTVDLSEVVLRHRRALVVRVSDGTGNLTLRFFHFNESQRVALQRGARLRCYGEARTGPAGIEMVHPEYRVMRTEEETKVDDALTPVYPATEGLQQARMRKLVAQALEMLATGAAILPELLPDDLLTELALPDLHQALLQVHRPAPETGGEALDAGQHPAQRRLAFEELLAQHLSLKLIRRRSDAARAPVLGAKGRLVEAFLASLPFTLTGAQRRVLDELVADLRRAHPMMRLVQGDVGSGKTVVAAAAALHAVESGCQAVLMAPTELLAEQHARNFEAWLAPLGVTMVFLSGRIKGRARTTVLEAIASGGASLVIGTHALFQEAVRFARLSLVIVDEQHRFGVHQRLALREKGADVGWMPHQLIMTATPIPRTLAMCAYADLDDSVIDELPPGRTPVRTVVIPDSRRHEVVERVINACAGGRQAYWVCTLIDESDTLEARAAEETADALALALPSLRIGLVHGRLKPTVRATVMDAFKAGDIDLLVATTVIEVGVDVPNATLMVIENAERMGLAQLHQLRGRVGRGVQESNCVLMYKAPLSKLAHTRLSVLRETTDGFVIAAEDLRLRGPGEVLGTRQTGVVAMRIADLVRDGNLLPRVQQAAGSLLAGGHERRIQALVRRWHGGSERYARA